MKNLTKYFSEYLPYDVTCTVTDQEVVKSGVVLNAVYKDGSCSFEDLVESEHGFEDVKLELIDLEDFGKIIKKNSVEEIDIEVNQFVKDFGFENLGVAEEKLQEFIAIQYYIFKHVDVFNLIEKGFAVKKKL